MPRKSRITRRKCRMDIGRFWVLDWKKSGRKFFLRSTEQWKCTTDKVVHRFEEIGHFVFKTSVLWVVGLERRIEVTKAFTSVEIQQTQRTLVLHHAVHQVSIHGAVANWCRQFGLTEEEGKNQFLSGHFLTTVPFDEVQFLASLPTNASEKQFAIKHLKLHSGVQQNPFPEVMRRRSLWTPCFSLVEVYNSTWRGRRVGCNCSILSGIHIFSSTFSFPSLWSNFLANTYWTIHWSSNREN